jgi:hypothetical protein
MKIYRLLNALRMTVEILTMGVQTALKIMQRALFEGTLEISWAL